MYNKWREKKCIQFYTWVQLGANWTYTDADVSDVCRQTKLNFSEAAFN